MNDTTTIVIKSSGATLLSQSTMIISTGGMGPAGPAGPPGPVGPGGGSSNFALDQVGASVVWVMAHGFGWKPNVQVFDTAGEEMFGYIRTDSLDMNTTTLTWELLISGRALAS